MDLANQGAQVKTFFKKKLQDLKAKDGSYLLVNGLVLLVSIYFVWNTVVAIRHNQKLELKLSVLEQKAALLEESNKNLELQKNYYSSDEFRAKVLKNNFNLVKPGEKMLVIKDLPAPENKKGTVFDRLQELDRLLESP